MSTGIERIALYDLRVPLKRPYHWAGGDITHFTSLIAVVEGEGRQGVGECTTVVGYSPESPEEAWDFARVQAPRLLGGNPDEARQDLLRFHHRMPFAITALITAVEQLRCDNPLAPLPEEQSVSLVGIVNVESQDELQEYVPELLEAGYSTLKVKVGFDVDKDIHKVRITQELVGNQGMVRIDANQAYTFEAAQRFVQSVDPANIELFEQPFAPGDWASMLELSRECPLPLMLDESIYGEEDILRTSDLACARYVKLKLMKAGSAASLLRQIELARAHDLKVVLGNGVATDVGCYHEALLAARAGIDTAGEMNGFLKPWAHLCQSPLSFRRGELCLSPGFSQSLDAARLQECVREVAVWPRESV